MRAYPKNSPQAAARIVALTVIADGDIRIQELQLLDSMRVHSALGLDRALFLSLLEPAEHRGRIDPEHQRRDQRDHDGPAANLPACAAHRKAAAALILNFDRIGIEIVEPHG